MTSKQQIRQNICQGRDGERELMHAEGNEPGDSKITAQIMHDISW